MKRIATIAALVVLFAACSDTVTEPPQSAGPPRLQTGGATGTTECRSPTFPPGTYHNVVVPPGETCFIGASVITGHLTALEGSTLGSFSNVVGRGIEAIGAVFVVVQGGEVDGNIRIVDGRGRSEDFWSFRLRNVTVHRGHVRLFRNIGGIHVRENTIENSYLHVKDNTIREGEDLSLILNTVGRHIEVFRNRGPGSKAIQVNTAGEYVSCQGNDLPFTGVPNFTPRTEGQCAEP